MLPGDIVKAKVFATEPYGIYLRYPTRDGLVQGLAKSGEIDILIRITDISWRKELSTKEFTSIGEELEVKILSIIDEKNAIATLLEMSDNE